MYYAEYCPILAGMSGRCAYAVIPTANHLPATDLHAYKGVFWAWLVGQLPGLPVLYDATVNIYPEALRDQSITFPVFQAGPPAQVVGASHDLPTSVL